LQVCQTVSPKNRNAEGIETYKRRSKTALAIKLSNWRSPRNAAGIQTAKPLKLRNGISHRNGEATRLFHLDNVITYDTNS
jgi:hypothetical protein